MASSILGRPSDMRQENGDWCFRPKTRLSWVSALWSKAAPLVELAQNYFNMQWNKTYEEFTSIESVVQNLDGEYVFAGNSGNDTLVTSTDSFGTILWNFKLTNWNAYQENSKVIILTNYGDYIVLNSNSDTSYLVKIIPPSYRLHYTTEATR